MKTIREYSIKIYDMLGRLVKSTEIYTSNAGELRYTWDGINNAGESVPSGIYFAQVTGKLDKAEVKITLLK